MPGASQLVQVLAYGLPALQRGRVARDVTLQPVEGIESDGDGHDHEHGTAQLADRRRTPPQRADPARELAARDGDREQRHGRTDRERRGHEHRGQADLVRRSDHGDRRENRPGARHVEYAEREAEHEPACPPARTAGGYPRERALEQHTELRYQIAEPDEYQQGDARVAQ